MTRLSASPTVDGGTYSSGGGITVAADVIETEGLVTVCGVWAQSEQQSVLTKGVEHKLLGSGSVYLGDTAVVRGLAFMNEVEPLNSYAGVLARCVKTDVAWTADSNDAAIKIRIPAQNVYVDGDEDGVVIVRFKQTGPGAEAKALLETIVDEIKG
ncbi:hypothetical protein RAZWK3B_12604 [Roseobacter sp. AzwK-3b]|uniref:hypothetical protein n=1 Tax=Roseobacter sp. AzwK-3b TaxID=351016 RepID=UPI000156A0A2|nr:hypothetical protein [Roseobacter sp. AzwK-3b]EDM69430.1 hypothetical protein RAZWK3B_12604 [Roseobacter sp. AzwK-3b]